MLAIRLQFLMLLGSLIVSGSSLPEDFELFPSLPKEEGRMLFGFLIRAFSRDEQQQDERQTEKITQEPSTRESALPSSDIRPPGLARTQSDTSGQSDSRQIEDIDMSIDYKESPSSSHRKAGSEGSTMVRKAAELPSYQQAPPVIKEEGEIPSSPSTNRFISDSKRYRIILKLKSRSDNTPRRPWVQSRSRSASFYFGRIKSERTERHQKLRDILQRSRTRS